MSRCSWLPGPSLVGRPGMTILPLKRLRFSPRFHGRSAWRSDCVRGPSAPARVSGPPMKSPAPPLSLLTINASGQRLAK
jgi:hypothetical protein